MGERRDFAVGKKAQDNLREALQEIALAVGSTMGPGGRSFGFDRQGTDLRLTYSFSKDGLVTTRSLSFDKPAWQAVLQYCRQAASHSVLASGDGTSSTIVLAANVARAVAESQHSSPQAFARQIEHDANAAIEAIKTEAIKSKKATRLVALTSTNGDEELTDVVLQSIKHSSAFGSILVEKNPASSVRYKIDRQDGYSNCKGYDYNNTFAQSVSENAAASKPIEWDRPNVIIVNGNIHVNSQIEPIVKAWKESLEKEPRSLALVAYEISDEVCNKLLVINRKMAAHKVGIFVVKPRLTAEINSGLQVIRDIAAFCGIEDHFIVDGGNFDDLNPEFFGTCGKIKITPTNTMFLGRAPDHWVEKRVLQNKSIVDEARSTFDCDMTSLRNAELAEGLVKVEVGGGLLPDLEERAHRFDDASKAAQSCMEYGALPGCGCSYIRAGILAGVHPALEKALRSIHNTVLWNYGTPANPEYVPTPNHTMYLSLGDKGIKTGNAMELGVLDACETICAVIKNGVALGVTIATIGGYSFRDKEHSDDS
jgi:chaperonin GroEL